MRIGLGLLTAGAMLAIGFGGCDSKENGSNGSGNDAKKRTAIAVGSPAQPTGNKIDQLAAADNEAIQLKQQLHDQRVEFEKLRYELSLAMKKRDAEAQTPAGASDETKTVAAKATVNYQEAMEMLIKRLDQLMEKLNKLAAGVGEKPVTTAGTTTKKEWEKAGDDAGNPPPPAPSPPAGSASDESKEAFKEVAAGFITAICLAQPEICPFVGPLVAALGLFSSDEDRRTFLDGVTNLAMKKPLTDKQREALSTVLNGPIFNELPPGALAALARVGQSDAKVKKAIEEATRDLLNGTGLDGLVELLDKLGPQSKVADVEAIQTLLGGRFPNPSVKMDCLKRAAARAISKPVLEALEKIQ